MAIAKYTLTVYVDRPVDSEDDPQCYIDCAAKRDLEKEVLQCLRRLDGDCDCEVMTVELVSEE